MGILKNKNSAGRGIMIGTYVSAEDASFLALFCAANSITKTGLFRELILGKIEDLKNKNSEDELATMIARIGKRAKKGSKKTDDEFFEELSDELSKKGVNEELIDSIIDKIIQNEATEKAAKKRR